MKNWFLWFLAGLIAAIGGVLALYNPFIATLSVDIIIGSTFLAAGIIAFILAFNEPGWGARLWAMLVSILVGLTGILMLTNPTAGIISLTLAAAILLMASGILKVIFAFNSKNDSYFWFILLSGIVSIILSAMILGYFPYSAAVTLGTFLGIDLIFFGISLMTISLAFKSRNFERNAA